MPELRAGKQQIGIARIFANHVDRSGVGRNSVGDLLKESPKLCRDVNVDVVIVAAMIVEGHVGGSRVLCEGSIRLT